MFALLLRRLRMDQRTAPGHLLRLFAAGSLLFTIVSVTQSPVSLAAPGLTVYRWIVWVDSLLISVASMAVFASIIAAEREQGTLPLLRMTGMSPLSLLLGQGFSGIVTGCLLLIVQLPLVVLTITLGGILWDQVLATYVALLAHLVLCAGIGLFWSVACARAGSAAFFTLLSLFGLWAGTYFARMALNGFAAKGWISATTQTAVDEATLWIDQRLVWSRLSEISSSFGRLDLLSPQFWWSLGGGIAFVLAASWLLDRRPFETPLYRPIVIRLWKSSGNRAWKRLAISGKDYRQFMGGVKGIVARILIYLAVPSGIAWLFEANGARITWEDYTSFVFWFGAAFLTVELAAIASRSFRNELAEQTWSSLAVLPRWGGRIVAEKLWGAGLGLVPGIVICLIAALNSRDVQRFFIGPSYRNEEFFLMLFLLVQPVFWSSVTAYCALLMVGVSPTVTIFCGFLAIILQYAAVFLVCMTVVGINLRFETFAMSYLSVAAVTTTYCFVASFVRLRKLTARN